MFIRAWAFNTFILFSFIINYIVQWLLSKFIIFLILFWTLPSFCKKNRCTFFSIQLVISQAYGLVSEKKSKIQQRITVRKKLNAWLLNFITLPDTLKMLQNWKDLPKNSHNFNFFKYFKITFSNTQIFFHIYYRISMDYHQHWSPPTSCFSRQGFWYKEDCKVIKKLYENNKMKFTFGNVNTWWLENNIRVQQGCVMSPTLFKLQQCCLLAQVRIYSSLFFLLNVVIRNIFSPSSILNGYIKLFGVCSTNQCGERLLMYCNTTISSRSFPL